MSIFKGTLAPEIAAQLKARENIVFSGKNDRDENFLRYTTGKNSWVRMSSFVNVNGKDDLAKSWILEGGVPYGSPDTSVLRYGVGKKESIYANNLADDDSKRPYGYRPMPGITSVTVTNKGAYGSLRQVTIRYQCWDRHQLDQLEKLYMRVGYTVFLEWGWSQYIDHPKSGTKGINTYPDLSKTKIENFSRRYVINVFNAAQTEDGIYNEIDKNVLKYRGNWDGMLGYVQNFSWQLLPNGGFDCTTTLISRGEVLSEIKGSSNPYTIIDSGITNNNSIKTQYDPNGTTSQNPVLSLFEKIFLNLKAYINQGEIYDANGEFYVAYSSGSASDATRLSNSQAIQNQVKLTLDNIKTAYDSNDAAIRNNNVSNLNTYNYGSKTLDLNELRVGNKPIVGGEDGTTLEYINFGIFVHIINTFFLPKDIKNKKQIVYIASPSETPILVCEDSVSIDPTTCLFFNDKATFITNIESNSCSDSSSLGFAPKVYEQLGAYTIPFTSSFGNRLNLEDFITAKSKLTKDGDPILVGNLGSINICVSKIIEVYRRLMSSDGVNIIEYLQALLEEISFAMGGINDFKVYTEKKVIQIIDAKYLETSGDPDGAYSQKFKFDLIGLKSICRDVKINSRIFSEQASMIAIGAAASGENKNIGDIYSTTQQKFNEGLTDRLIQELQVSPDADKASYYYDLFQNLVVLNNYLQKKVIGYIDPCITDPASMLYGPDADGKPLQKIIVPSKEEIVNASSLLKSFLLQLDGKDLDFKALIPLELEITLDGISGFIIGQIFTIDESIIPTFYQKNKVGFIITGVSHTLQNNDWVTTLKTQMCLLDNDQTKSTLNLSEKNKLKNILTRVRTQVAGSSYVALAMADYLVYLTVNIIFSLGDVPRDTRTTPVKKGNLGLAATDALPVNINPGSTNMGSSVEHYYVFYPPDGEEGSNKWFNQVNPNVTGAASTNKAVKQVAELIKGDLPFYVTGGGDCYLKRWFDIANVASPRPANLPATYNELIKFNDPVTGNPVDLESDLLLFNKEATGQTDYNNINSDSIKANELFFYNPNYLSLTPLSNSPSAGYGLGGFIRQPGVKTPRGPLVNSYDFKDKSMFDLEINSLFIHYLRNGIINHFLPTISNRRYIDPSVHRDFYSVESGTINTTTIWYDGYVFTTPPSL